MTPSLRLYVLSGAALLVLVCTIERGEAHKPITSKYTYNEHVFPIVRAHCGRCHVSGGVAPMSLMTYTDAFPWAESIRSELIAGHMPPWNAEGVGVRSKNGPSITAREIDTLLTWASGGTPVGNPANAPPPVALKNEWSLGEPDLVLPLPSEMTLAADQSAHTQEFTVATGLRETRWVRAVDLLPGTPAIVRSATVSVRSNARAGKPRAGDGASAEAILALWVPGDDPVSTDEGTAFRLPARSSLTVRVRYRKTWLHEGQAMADRSAVALYFAKAPAVQLQPFTLVSPVITANDTRLTFSRVVEADMEAVAFHHDPDLSNVALEIDAVSAAGSRTPLIRLSTRSGWARRYWFEQPAILTRGMRLEAVATLNGTDTLLPPASTPAPVQSYDGSTVRLTFDVVPPQGRPTSPQR